MSCEWHRVTTGDILELINGFAFKSKEFIDCGVPVLKIKNVKAGRLILDDLSYVDKKFLDVRKEKVVREGDLLVTMTGNRHDGSPETWVGKVAWFGGAGEFLINQRVGIMRIKNGLEINSRFLGCQLSSWSFQRYFISIATSSGGQANLSPNQIMSTSLLLPSKSIQDAVAGFIGNIEEKITLNTQINQTLEQMAQALFKSWFVDFDPVIDNALAAGNPIPKALAERAAKRQAMWAADNEAAPERLPAETRRLFPDRFEEDEALGWVPAGWQVKPLSQIAHYQNGLALQKFRPKEGEEFLPVLKIAQLRSGKTDGVEKASVNIKPECIVHNGDVVFSWSGTLMVDIWSGGKAALNQHLFKVTSEKYPKWFYFLWTQRHLELFQRIAADKAVTMGHIKRQHLTEAFCLVPDGKLINKAGELIKPLIDKMLNGCLENEELTQLRDTLLPKLLSGELQLPDAEAAIDAVLEAETA